MPKEVISLRLKLYVGCIKLERDIAAEESRIQSIDLEKKKVITGDGELEWDYLVVALGSTTNFSGMDDGGKNAMPLKSLSNGISIRNSILDSYEAALRE